MKVLSKVGLENDELRVREFPCGAEPTGLSGEYRGSDGARPRRTWMPRGLTAKHG